MNNRKSIQGPVRKYDLRALLVLFAIVGVYLGTAIYLLVMKALHG